MLHLHRKRRHLSRSRELAIVCLFTSIGMACVDTIWSLYLSHFGLGDSAIGYISAIFVMLSILMSFLAVPLLEYFRQTRLYLLSVLLSMGAYVIIGLVPNFSIFLLMATILAVAGTLRVASFDLLFRDNTPNNELNKEEGFLYALTNVGWLVGPLIAGFFLMRTGLQSVFLIIGSCYFMAMILFLFTHTRDMNKHRTHLNIHFLKNIIDFFSEKSLRLPFLISAGIYCWFALVFIYVPLFMIHEGLSEGSVGIFFSLLVIPLILFENKVGELSAKMGFRRFFLFGFVGIATLSLVMFFSSSIMLQLGLLVCSSIFVACIEPLQDTFFFKQLAPEDEERFYPIFGMATDAGSFLGKFVIATVLLFLPHRFAYVTMFVLMLFFAFIALKISKEMR